MNAIVSFAVGYGEKEIRPFVRSLQKNEISVELFLYVGENVAELKEAFRSEKWVHFMAYSESISGRVLAKVTRQNVHTSRLYSKVISFLHRSGYSVDRWGRPLMHFMSRRFLLLNDFFKEHVFDHYLITDLRDVFLQVDPFERLQPGVVYSGIEPRKVAECELNKSWMSQTFGEEYLIKNGHMPIVCAGVTLGDRESIGEYLKKMVDLQYTYLANIVNTLGPDQSIHTHILTNKQLDANVELQENGRGFIATLHHSTLDEFDIDHKTVRNKDGQIVPILHQYDRKDVLVEMFG